MIQTDVSLISSLIPNGLMDKITEERSMVVLAKLIAAILERTSHHLLNHEMKKFDANPGDAACESQALKLHSVAMNNLSDKGNPLTLEAQKLQELAKILKAKIHARSSNPKAQRESLPQAFFNQLFASATISKDMLYLMRTFLLTTTRVPDHVEENGVVVTKTDPGQLSQLCTNIAGILKGHAVNLFVEHHARELSKHTVECIQEAARKLNAPPPLAREMLADEHVLQPKVALGHLSKFCSCQYFQMLTLLQHLKETETIIAIKSIVKKPKDPTHVLLKASAKGFVPLTEEEIKSLAPEMPLIVFEGVVADEKNLHSQVLNIGFERMILLCTAQAPPYHSKSTLADIKVPQVRTLLEEECRIAKELGLDQQNHPFFLLDHVYCNIVKNENLRKSP